jgi:hypothetical protein
MTAQIDHTITFEIGPSFEEIRAKLDFVRLVKERVALKKVGDVWQGLCPFHSEKTASFTVYQDGRYHCFGCKAHGDAVDFLEKVEGLTTSEARAKAIELANLHSKPKREISRTPQIYLDENGQEAHRSIRIEFENGEKTFEQGRFEGNSWVPKIKDLPRLVLYHLDLLVRWDRKKPLFIVEGEKCADLLIELGLQATTHVGGTGMGWRDEYSDTLVGWDTVYILEDNDDPGRKWAGDVLKSIYPKVREAKRVQFSDLKKLTEDVYNWLTTYGHTVEELLKVCQDAPAPGPEQIKSQPGKQRQKPKGISAKELKIKEFAPQPEIIKGILPVGCTLLAAKPKIGKSWIGLQTVIAVAAGGVALSQKLTKGEAIYLALEDNERRLKKRLEKICPNDVPDGLMFFTKWARSDEGGFEDLDEWLTDNPKIKLVVIDTLQKWRKPATGRDNIFNADYEALQNLTGLADKHGVAILVIHHTRKGSSEDPLDEISGSMGLSAAADNALVLRRERGQADAVLHRLGRDFDDDRPYALQFDATTAIWTVLGYAEDYENNENQVEIINLLKQQPLGLKPVEIGEELGAFSQKEKDVIRQRCWRMWKAGDLVQLPNGKYTLSEKAKNDNSGNFGYVRYGSAENHNLSGLNYSNKGTDVGSNPNNVVKDVTTVANVASVAEDDNSLLGYSGYVALLNEFASNGDWQSIDELCSEFEASKQFGPQQKLNFAREAKEAKTRIANF